MPYNSFLFLNFSFINFTKLKDELQIEKKKSTKVQLSQINYIFKKRKEKKNNNNNTKVTKGTSRNKSIFV